MDSTNTPAGAGGLSPNHADWPKTLEWIEKQGQESLKSRFATADLLAKEAQTTLTVLLAGVGGSTAYAAKIFESASPGSIAIGAAAVCAYLVALSVLLVLLCMMFQSYPALSQDPRNLMHPTYSLDEIREEEVKNLDDRIADAKKINDTRASRLNRFRIAAALSPVVFVVSAVLAPPAAAPKAEKARLTCLVAPAAAGASAASASTASLSCEMVH